MSRLRRTLATPRLFWGSFVLVLCMQLVMGYVLRDAGEDLVPLQLTFDADVFRDIVAGWTPEQLAQYKAHFAPDFAYPVMYGFFLMCWLARVLTKCGASARWDRAFILPCIAVFADFCENALHIALWDSHASPDAVLVLIAGCFAAVKWGVLALLFGCLIVLSVIRIRGAR